MLKLVAQKVVAVSYGLFPPPEKFAKCRDDEEAESKKRRFTARKVSELLGPTSPYIRAPTETGVSKRNVLDVASFFDNILYLDRKTGQNTSILQLRRSCTVFCSIQPVVRHWQVLDWRASGRFPLKHWPLSLLR